MGDAETAEIAGQFVARHRARIELLERKLGVQREELAVAERDYEKLANRYRAARQGAPPQGGGPVEADLEPDLLQTRMDRKAAEAAAEAQLELLKRKLGRQ